MGFLRKLLGLEPRLLKLVSTQIVTDDEYRYFVTFSQHHPQLQLPEHVRLVLHFYAKILFNFDPSNEEMAQAARQLKEMMDRLLVDGVEKGSQVFSAVGIADLARMTTVRPTNRPREIVAVLYFVDTIQRHITTDIARDLYVQHAVFSVFALLQAVLTHVDEECVDTLGRALANMNRVYDLGQSYSELQNLAAIPTQAYLSAIAGEPQD
jgi:hypothetical protein